MKVLILGASGLLGSAMFRVLSQTRNLEVFGTTRNSSTSKYFSSELASQLIIVKDLEDTVELTQLLDALTPEVVINCMALARAQAQDFSRMIAIYSLLPRRLQHLCREREIRLVQISSDAVFSGKRGGYTESDLPDARDPYGIAKLLGEVDGPQALTLRTSMLGPELASQDSLLAWFLRQEKECHCYTRAIFSGFPSVVLAGIMRDFILPNTSLTGVYHVSSDPISKFDLLTLVSQQYGKKIAIMPDDSVAINRSLCADRFRLATGYSPPSWVEMIIMMHAFNPL